MEPAGPLERLPISRDGGFPLNVDPEIVSADEVEIGRRAIWSWAS